MFCCAFNVLDNVCLHLPYLEPAQSFGESIPDQIKALIRLNFTFPCYVTSWLVLSILLLGFLTVRRIWQQ